VAISKLCMPLLDENPTAQKEPSMPNPVSTNMDENPEDDNEDEDLDDEDEEDLEAEVDEELEPEHGG